MPISCWSPQTNKPKQNETKQQTKKTKTALSLLMREKGEDSGCIKTRKFARSPRLSFGVNIQVEKGKVPSLQFPWWPTNPKRNYNDQFVKEEGEKKERKKARRCLLFVVPKQQACMRMFCLEWKGWKGGLEKTRKLWNVSRACIHYITK